MEINVKNVPDSTENCDCCGSWIAHYKNRISPKTTVLKCGVYGCKEGAEVGGHIYKVINNMLSKQIYIIPLCKSDNYYTNKDIMKLKNNVQNDEGI